MKKLAELLGWQAELDRLVSACGGWPPAGPVLPQISELPPKKQISRDTAEAMAKVLRGIVGGKGAEGKGAEAVAGTGSGGGGESDGKGKLTGLFGRLLSKTKKQAGAGEAAASLQGQGAAGEDGGGHEEEEDVEQAARETFATLVKALRGREHLVKILVLQAPVVSAGDVGVGVGQGGNEGMSAEGGLQDGACKVLRARVACEKETATEGTHIRMRSQELLKDLVHNVAGFHPTILLTGWQHLQSEPTFVRHT